MMGKATTRNGVDAVTTDTGRAQPGRTRLGVIFAFRSPMEEEITPNSGALQKDPEEWKTGDEPMTAAQRSYLETLAADVGESFDEQLTKGRSVQIDRCVAATVAADYRRQVTTPAVVVSCSAARPNPSSPTRSNSLGRVDEPELMVAIVRASSMSVVAPGRGA
jgi:hypothetical protein